MILERAIQLELTRVGLTIPQAGGSTFQETLANTVANPDGQPREEDEAEDLMRSLCAELARHGETLMEGFLRTGEVQILELHLGQNGQAADFEVRAVVCVSKEVLAVVADVTARKEAENALTRSTDELTRLNGALQNELCSRAEEEEILKRSFGKLGKLLEGTIEVVTLIVRKKDPDTARHQERVSKLACAIAREMGLKSSQVDVIGLAALLHDLGKVFIPAETLAKPGKLSESEFSLIKNHAEADFQILRTIDLFGPIAEIAHQHHERLNGSGYPLALKGDDILVEARVVAVADVVEAMVSDRPYRPARGVEAALNEIAAGKGTLYDPDAANACIRLFREGKFEFDGSETDLPPQTG